MGFLNGRVTFTRYRVSGSSPLPFADELLALAEQHAAGRHGSADPTDGVSTGWAGGDHVLDLTFDLAKNVVNDALHLAIRIDTDKIPGSLLKAYTQIETEALAKLNPSGHADQGPASGGQGSRPPSRRGRSRRRPFPPAQPLPGSLGWPDRRALRGHHQHDRSGAAGDALPRVIRPHSRADHRRQPGQPAWGQRMTTRTRELSAKEPSASSAASSPSCQR